MLVVEPDRSLVRFRRSVPCVGGLLGGAQAEMTAREETEVAPGLGESSVYHGEGSDEETKGQIQKKPFDVFEFII